MGMPMILTSVKLATLTIITSKPEDLSLIPGTYAKEEEENQL